MFDPKVINLFIQPHKPLANKINSNKIYKSSLHC